MTGRHVSEACSQPVEQTSWPGSSERDAIWVITLVARPHICSFGCTPLVSEIRICPWNLFKGNGPWNQGPLWRRWPSACPWWCVWGGPSWASSLDSWEPGALLWGWFPRPRLIRNVKERPTVYLGASLYFVLSSEHVWVTEDEDGRMDRGWGLYDIKGISFLSFHSRNLFWLQVSFFSWMLPAHVFCLFLPFFFTVTYNVFMSVLSGTYSNFHPRGCYQLESSAEIEKL